MTTMNIPLFEDVVFKLLSTPSAITELGVWVSVVFRKAGSALYDFCKIQLRKSLDCNGFCMQTIVVLHPL